MGLASGDAPWWSEDREVRFKYPPASLHLSSAASGCSPAGIISDSVVADADLMTLLSGLEVAAAGTCLSPSPESSRWRALRAARSLMARGVEGESLLSAAGLAPLLPLLARSLMSPELPAAETDERK